MRELEDKRSTSYREGDHWGLGFSIIGGKKLYSHPWKVESPCVQFGVTNMLSIVLDKKSFWRQNNLARIHFDRQKCLCKTILVEGGFLSFVVVVKTSIPWFLDI